MKTRLANHNLVMIYVRTNLVSEDYLCNAITKYYIPILKMETTIKISH